MSQTWDLPHTLGALRRSPWSQARIATRTVKDEIRENLIRRLSRGETLFAGIAGYEDTVVPQVVNAILSRHNFILLGLRGQAKTRLIRMLTSLLDRGGPNTMGLTRLLTGLVIPCRRDAGAMRRSAILELSHRPSGWSVVDARPGEIRIMACAPLDALCSRRRGTRRRAAHRPRHDIHCSSCTPNVLCERARLLWSQFKTGVFRDCVSD
jgi:hypothetical protein